MSLYSMAANSLTLLRQRPKGWRALLFNTAMAKAKRTGPLLPPVHVTIEPTNVCNLRCPICEAGNHSLKRQASMMDFKAYQRLIDDIAGYTSVLMFYFMGEPFLHRNAYEMIRYARERGIHVETCTNGEYVDAEGVIYSDINEISYQIGGITQETHQVYRVNGDLELTLERVRQLVALRERYPDSSVQIELGFIVMRHNEHEVAEFLELAKAIGVDKANIIDPCVRTVEEGQKLLPENRQYWFYDQKAFDNGVLRPKYLTDNHCEWVWNSALILCDGSMVPCCRDVHGTHTFGNVFENSYTKIWNAPSAQKFRRHILDDQGSIDVCKLCSGFGLPQLIRARPVGFEVQRLSIDPDKLDLPPVELDHNIRDFNNNIIDIKPHE